MEETTMSDHRKLGRELSLFDTDPLIGAGLPYWLPDGAIVRHELEEYVRRLERRAGYRHVYSPVLGKRELYEISGHWQHYREDMYPPMDIGGEQVVLRPSLCPHHALIYRSRAHSYRELPLRIAELGGMFRAERSGVLGGLTRVRAIQLNDAHIFCTPDQVTAEVVAALALIDEAYAALGLRPGRYRLSLPGPGVWRQSADLLVAALTEAGLEYEAVEGEAAFYGPKIDVQVVDSAGRESTLSTVQVDFHQPEQFGLAYVGADAARHRPVMVHRSIVGSAERAVAQLIEEQNGAFPPWLAPTQVIVLPISAEQSVAARSFQARCEAQDLRAELATEGSLNARIRASRLVPYQAVIGPKEAKATEVTLRLRNGTRLDPMPVADAVTRINAIVADRQGTTLWHE
jgi:threonyl-tRNA synthetase